MATPELFSIVVLGSMNPAIHHPLWYRMLELLSADEEQLAMSGPDLQVGPAYSQFTAGKISVTCLQPRWAVQTTDEALFDRLVHIANKTMDTLTHTPVTHVGINFDFCRPSGVKDAAAIIGARAREARLGFAGSGEVFGTVTFNHRRTARMAVVTTTEIVAPDPTDPSRVLVKYNVELRLTAAQFEMFEFAKLLAEHVGSAKAESSVFLERALAAIRSLEN
jgi:hypothetical protein